MLSEQSQPVLPDTAALIRQQGVAEKPVSICDLEVIKEMVAPLP